MTRTYTPLYGRVSMANEAEELQAEFERAAAEFSDDEEIEGDKALHLPTISVEQSAEYLNQTLPTFGITNAVRLRGLESEDAASICNILHILIHQRQKEHEYRKVTEEQLVRLRTEVQSLEQAKDRLGHKLDAKERENGSWMVKERQLKQAHEAAVRKMTVEREALVKAKAGLSRKCTQLQHEAKRKELECSKLGERLRGVLADKTRVDARAAKELERAMIRTNGPSNPSVPPSPRGGPSLGSRRPGSTGAKMEDDTFKMVVSAYEAKNKELTDENRDIKASLAALQKEHLELVNARSSYTPPSALSEMLKQSDSELCHSISYEIHSLNKRVQAAVKSKQSIAGKVTTPLEKELDEHVNRLAQVISEQEQLMGTAVLGLENSHKQMSEVQEEVNKLTGEIDSARSERKESQRQLQTVIKEREDLAAQVHGEKAAHVETRGALELVKQKVTELHGQLSEAKSKSGRDFHEQKEVLERERRELGEARQHLDETQTKLQGGYSDLVSKRQEVLSDIAKENSRLAHSWDQVKLARKEIEVHQGKLKEAWRAVEAAKRESGLDAAPRPSLQHVSSPALATPEFISHEDSPKRERRLVDLEGVSSKAPVANPSLSPASGSPVPPQSPKAARPTPPASPSVSKREFDPLASPQAKKTAPSPAKEQRAAIPSSSSAHPSRSTFAAEAAQAPGFRDPKVHRMTFGRTPMPEE